MKVHFIAIGGAAMHNLAIALHKKGCRVTGSDDEIFEPSKSRLARYGLLPSREGWDASHITPELDAVILGMHARADNPEIARAQELGIRIYSFPEYLYEHSKDKVRVVIGGSHGKTTTTAIILHVLQHAGIEADYMVGAQLEGFEVMVRLSDTARFMVLEGDEYLTSATDRRPKFHVYRPHIALLTGIAWDHINVFPTYEKYVEQFRTFVDMISDPGTPGAGGVIIYCAVDDEVRRVVDSARGTLRKIPYDVPEHVVENAATYLTAPGQRRTPLAVFGRHNLLNIAGAYGVCREMGVRDDMFYSAIGTFKGASKRLEMVARNEQTAVYRDFAHAPSKLKATTDAVKEQYPERPLTACMELHTYSSLSREFLSHYRGAMDGADEPIVFFSPHAIELKKLPPITAEQVKDGFGCARLEVYTDPAALRQHLLDTDWSGRNLLLMTSGDFGGMDILSLGKKITS